MTGAQCDAIRPSCTRCANKALICKYDVESGVSRSMSMRRKNGALQREVDQLRELLNHNRSLPKLNPLESYQQLCEPASPAKADNVLNDGGNVLQPHANGVRNETLASELKTLDVAALNKSTSKVRARPWTTLAGDGIVSELIYSFFASDNNFYLSFVDQQYFLDDMEAGDTSIAEFCSPLLVNAICALRCVSNTKQDIDACC